MMQAAALLENLQLSGIAISVENGKLKVDAPKGKLSPESREMIRACKSEILGKLFQDRINVFIKRGIFFEVTANSFNPVGNINLLTENDNTLLAVDSTAILCHLQQMMLVRDLFEKQPEALEEFRIHTAEREAIFANGAETISNEMHTAAVIETTKRWFADVYKEIL